MTVSSSQTFIGSHNACTPSDDKNSFDGDMLAQATRAVYKKNVELAIRNKILSVLRTIYDITMSSVDVTDSSQRIVDSVVQELSMPLAMLFLHETQNEEQKAHLRLIAVNQTAKLEQSFVLIQKFVSDVVISRDCQDNLLNQSLACKEKQVTGNMLDLMMPFLTQTEADTLESSLKIKSFIVYPLFFGGRELGVFIIGIGKTAEDLSRAENMTLDELISVIGIALDRARLYKDLQDANSQLQELDRLKDEFVSLASHELRTPMTAIRGSLSTILDGYVGEISKEARDFLTAAYNENDRLIRLVNNLLNISRIEAGRLMFSLVELDCQSIIREVVKNLSMAAKEKNLFFNYEDTPISKVLGDQDKIQEVLINLVGNALKFTHQGGVTIKAIEKEGMALISVTDTGSGITEEDQKLLFKKFSQVGQGYSKQVGGTGLGLYICKKIIEGMKGSIWLESTIGKGSTFYFTLPLATS